MCVNVYTTGTYTDTPRRRGLRRSKDSDRIRTSVFRFVTRIDKMI